MKNNWTITVTRIGTRPPEVVEKVEFQCTTPIDAENKLGDVWNAGTNGAYANQPGHFRAKLRAPDGSIYQTID